MPVLLAILEDNERRRAAMRAVLQTVPNSSAIFFDTASEMIAWFQLHQCEVDLVSLDHDLPVRRMENGEVRDCGSGKEVAEFLAAASPTCPLIIHSSNAIAAESMIQLLVRTGWPITRVVPEDDLEWVESQWAKEVNQRLRHGAA